MSGLWAWLQDSLSADLFAVLLAALAVAGAVNGVRAIARRRRAEPGMTDDELMALINATKEPSDAEIGRYIDDWKKANGR